MQRRSEPNIWEESSLWRVKSNFFRMHFLVLSLKYIYFIGPTILFTTIYIWPSYFMNTKQNRTTSCLLEFLYVLDLLPLMNGKPSLHWTWAEWNMSIIKGEWVIMQRPPGLQEKLKVNWHFPQFMIHSAFVLIVLATIRSMRVSLNVDMDLYCVPECWIWFCDPINTSRCALNRLI